MKLGLDLGYSGARMALPMDKILLAERLGFDSLWTAETYGSDAITPLAYLAALTKHIRLATGIAHGDPAIGDLAGEADIAFCTGAQHDRDIRIAVQDALQRLAEAAGEGLAKRTDGRSLKDLEIVASLRVIITDDVKAAMAQARASVALYVGGMGAKGQNYHKDAMIDRGFGAAAARIQELYLAGHKQEAEAAVPEEYLDQSALYGTPERIKQRFAAWRDSAFTTLRLGEVTEEAMVLMSRIARD